MKLIGQLFWVVIGTFLWTSATTVVTLSGGYLTVNGSITSTYYDFTINLEANV